MSNLPRTLLRFSGSRNLVQRLIIATLTGQAIRISNIRSNIPNSPGLSCHEISFLRLLDTITNGSKIEFSYTGTTLVYRPGLLVGTSNGYGAIEGISRHEIPEECTRGITYFIEPLSILSLFSKAPIHVLFTGKGVITSATSHGDISIDTLRTALMPLLANFGVQSNLELRALRRSCPGLGSSEGTGEVQVHFKHQFLLPKTVHLVNPGKIKRVRGFAYSIGTSAMNNARMIDAARNVLNQFVSDIYIYSDFTTSLDRRKGTSLTAELGRPGFGISLVAESTSTCLYSADTICSLVDGEPAEEVGKRCAYQLMEAIDEGGCVPITAAPLILLLMAMGSDDIGRLQIAKSVVTTPAILLLARDLEAFGMGLWTLEDSPTKPKEMIINIFGHSIGNIGRKIT